MLEIKNFSKKYGDKEAVSSLSFVVNDGDIMGFVGKNGAGKTTTLKACMGIITLTEGDILLDGISVVKDPIVCKRSMAYVPDTPRLEEYMTGMQYLNFVCDIYQVPSKERQQNIERLIHKGIVGALVARERHRYFSIPVYVINTASGYMMATVFVVFAVVIKGDVASQIDQFGKLFQVPSASVEVLYFPKHLFIGNAVIILIVVGLTAAAILWLKEKGEILYRKL